MNADLIYWNYWQNQPQRAQRAQRYTEGRQRGLFLLGGFRGRGRDMDYFNMDTSVFISVLIYFPVDTGNNTPPPTFPSMQISAEEVAARFDSDIMM